jgi:hypothetical protein
VKPQSRSDDAKLQTETTAFAALEMIPLVTSAPSRDVEWMWSRGGQGDRQSMKQSEGRTGHGEQ